MDYTDLEDLAWRQEASAQLGQESGAAADKAADEQLRTQQQTHLWTESEWEASTTPTGSPPPSVWRGKEVREETIVYEEEEVTNTTIEEWIRNGQLGGGTTSVSSAATVVRHSRTRPRWGMETHV